jgi:hypothetical protein
MNGATPQGKGPVAASSLVGVEKTVDFRLADQLFLLFLLWPNAPIFLARSFQRTVGSNSDFAHAL